MSVIITGMNMPYRCDECPLVTDNECPLLGIDVDEEEGSRDLRCPLKSVEELIEEIKAEIRQTLDKDWSDGLYQALCIIKKHMKGEGKK